MALFFGHTFLLLLHKKPAHFKLFTPNRRLDGIGVFYHFHVEICTWV